MNFKKLLALLLAAIMALSLVACGDDSKDDTADTDKDNTADVEAVEPGFYDEAGNKLMGDEDVFVTINGYEIPFDEYRYMYQYVDAYYFSQGTPGYWESNANQFPLLKLYAEQFVIESNWCHLLSDKYDIELTDEDMNTVQAYLEEQATYFETPEEYEEALEMAGITENLLERLFISEVLSERVYQTLFGENGTMTPSDDEIKATLEEDYTRVHHVLISFEHFYGAEGYENATEEELKQAALDLANETLTQLQNGEADIYELAQTVGDDPGMIDNENGYFFTYGEKVEPFEETSFALGMDELSGLVETDYGYHIIKRLEQKIYVKENWDECKKKVVDAEFNTLVNELIDSAEIVYNEYYTDMTANSIK